MRASSIGAINHQSPLFPFGFGLSYTKFKYGPLSVMKNRDGTWTARVTVTNTGRRAGDAVPQLYLRYPHAAGEAPWNLKGFDKIALGPRSSRTVSFTVDDRALRVYDDRSDGWKVVSGDYTLAIGSSSRDLRSRVPFAVRR
jgi:beta-glucosidase